MTEVEVKLSLHDTLSHERFLSLGKLISDDRFVACPTNVLRNIYFDSAQLALHERKIALRLRQYERAWVQTLKTKGVSVDGLHQRGEWEWPLSSMPAHSTNFVPRLNAALLRASRAWPQDQSIAALLPMFETNFTRYCATFYFYGCQIELVYDHGKIIAGQKVGNINELELELIAQEACAQEIDPLDVMRAVSSKAQAVFSGYPDDVSKAERGYGLLQKNS